MSAKLSVPEVSVLLIPNVISTVKKYILLCYCGNVRYDSFTRQTCTNGAKGQTWTLTFSSITFSFSVYLNCFTQEYCGIQLDYKAIPLFCRVAGDNKNLGRHSKRDYCVEGRLTFNSHRILSFSLGNFHCIFV